MTAPDDDLLLERQLCFALSIASRTVVNAYRPVLERLKLTHPQYLVMLILWEQDDRSLREISGILMMEPATISPMLKRLESLGYITRNRVPGNERTLAVRLTETGTALRAEAVGVPGTMLERLGLTREQVETLNNSMRGIIAAATRAGSPAG
ncbi:MarR family transcriptional regulator [Arthrobacter sp. MSA 4-2]|uniref:MarR family winged helix-turn-helix transcriptional regulator n=1 Tax=Arthrobacter sp. MSA 4-2 TaxID=2794349 RepID=UPI0018E87912|nr:MarR family transcriptional regulator [Arthrobacter sp. MSA 4-2]MBJ2120301.1 MarR family transcriptional regulator [Arthrobacter sp. MSA 4-2]